MGYFIAFLFTALIVVMVFFSLKQKEKRESQTQQLFWKSEPITSLLEAGFKALNSNSVVGEFNNYQVGIYYLPSEFTLEYFTFINTVIPSGIKGMQHFNKIYKSEKIAIDSKQGFRQEIPGELSETKIFQSFKRLTEIAKQNMLNPSTTASS